ncbi:MAG TPA: hypothetical protein VLW49_04015 [Gaiellaceae bacterium]|nr:hypothetical protein [Gaiellaceae bacterium]
MTEHSTLDRLETRLDLLVARVEALEERTLRGGDADDTLFDELVQIEDAPFAEQHARRRSTELLHVGQATGV